jgi:hypothetical protein
VMGSVDKTLFTLNDRIDFLLVQIYVGDTVFGGSSHILVSGFHEMMQEFHMSMMGELTFFFGIQVKQTKQVTFVHQAKYTKDLMKKFNIADLKPVSTSMSMTTSMDLDGNDEHDWFPLIPHSDTGGHSVCHVPVCALLGFPTLFTLDGSSVNLQVSETHSSLGFGISFLLRLILLAFLMMILLVVGLTE